MNDSLTEKAYKLREYRQLLEEIQFEIPELVYKMGLLRIENDQLRKALIDERNKGR